MPVLSARIICSILPEGAPLLLKPLLWCIFDAVNRRMVTPRLETHMEYVRTPMACAALVSDGNSTPDRIATNSERWRILRWRS